MSSAETEGVPGARPGDVLGGKYRVEKVLGAGGMGVVVAATHLQLDEKVAIKFLLPDAAKSADVVNRFQREARAAVKIKSEHVARVSDVGQLENGSPYMVMEYLQGKDLADTLEMLQANHQRGLQVQAAVEYVLQACEALAEAHTAGIVHRDLKPANLFLAHRADGSACIKVLDFGISKMVNSVSMPGMTKTTAVMGSPLYMSPEQLKSSKDVDHRTDIWSLGAILYELLSGDPPFMADTMPQLCMMILQGPLPPITQLRPDVPPQLEAVIRKCQEKDPSQRFQNVAELSAALAPFVSGRARLSAERIADVLRTSAERTGSNVGGSVRPPAPAGYTPQPPGAASNPNLGAQAGYGQQAGGGYVAQAQTAGFAPGQSGGHFGQSGGNFAQAAGQSGGNFAQAAGQSGGNFAQSNPQMAQAATVMGSPAMMAGGATVHGHGPPMAANTSSSWEGAMGAPKKKGSIGIIIGAAAGVLVLGAVAVAAFSLGGGGGTKDDNGTANNTIPTPPSTSAANGGGVAPAVTLGGEAPAATATMTTSATPSADPASGTPWKPGKSGKPGATATATATAAVTATTAATTSSSSTTTKKPTPGTMEDDRK